MLFFYHNMYLLISFMLLIMSGISLMLGLTFSYLSMEYFLEWNILSFNSISISMSMMVDFYSLIFSSFVMYISSSVFTFSKSYMEGEIYLRRFLLLLLLFVLSMLMLIFSGNLLTILLGWDGLGLVSFLLVIFYQNKSSLGGGLLTLLTNRLGDIALILSLSLMFCWSHFYNLKFMSMSILDNSIIILVFLSAMTKSAQMPFSAWLPAAMAAPTPVSSLVHSSTLVTAGVYLLIRFNELYINMNFYLMYIALITMFMSGLSANFEFDMKKIIALSTLSQLSVMFLALSLSMKILAYFHMLTHALFKALMFLSAGSVMHGYFGNQDMRMKGSMTFSPFISMAMNLSFLSLMGMPFLAGFYSKDMILEKFFMLEVSPMMMVILIVATMLTVTYSMRTSFYVIINYTLHSTCFNLFNNKYILKSLWMLMAASLLSGSMLMWLLFPIPESIFLNFSFKMTIFMILFMGIIFGTLMILFKFMLSTLMIMNPLMHYFMSQMWFISNSPQLLMAPPLLFSKSLMKMFDFGWSEMYGGQGIYKILNSSKTLSNTNFYNMMFYYLMFFIWMIMLLMMLMI
uniref:NADH-ubiquinone oxidoreductase chain 5 n=1 Tax=Rhynchothorax sp. JZ-2022 TaxID=2992009 RepID=A0A9E8AFW1_9CHEL|nr:NADH dehydrogenase subunit 5 [Rhynchothorax sp. JZ-2022]